MADTANILALSAVPTGSECSVAPLGTTLPTDATTTLSGSWTDLGIVTDDGVTVSDKRDITKHYGWDGEVKKVTRDKYTGTIKATLMESSPDVLKVVYGDDNVETATDSGHQIVTVEHSALLLEHRMWCFTSVDGDRYKRTIIRNGQVTEVGDIANAPSKPTVYELTIDVFKTAAGENGVVEIFDNTDVLAGS